MKDHYDLLYITLDNCLISVKSGDRYPRNIADMIPDYNLWYAIKFMAPRRIVIISNTDIPEWMKSYYHIKLEFISKWLSQMTLVSKVSSSFSYLGNWMPHFYQPGEGPDLIRGAGLNHEEREYTAAFIDTPERLSEEYIINNYPSLDYIIAPEFIEKFNTRTRIYEKKPKG